LTGEEPSLEEAFVVRAEDASIKTAVPTPQRNGADQL
jgi:hypothetical protein